MRHYRLQNMTEFSFQHSTHTWKFRPRISQRSMDRLGISWFQYLRAPYVPWQSWYSLDGGGGDSVNCNSVAGDKDCPCHHLFIVSVLSFLLSHAKLSFPIILRLQSAPTTCPLALTVFRRFRILWFFALQTASIEVATGAHERPSTGRSEDVEIFVLGGI